MLRTEWTSVGDLRALTWTPEHPVGGVVLVDGSGEGQLAPGFLPMLAGFLRSVG